MSFVRFSSVLIAIIYKDLGPMETFKCSGKVHYDINPRFRCGIGEGRVSEGIRTNPSEEDRIYVELIIYKCEGETFGCVA
jgi:hypothetical protein